MKESENRISKISASLRLCVVTLLLSISISAQWVKQTVNTTASFRGLSVVNEKVIWSSGTSGTVIMTLDGGKVWRVMTVPGAEKLDFRDIEAFDQFTAYVLSIGNGENSRMYKTIDGGKTWTLEFKNTNEKAFFDAIACTRRRDCIAMSDPVNGAFLLARHNSTVRIGSGSKIDIIEKMETYAGPEAHDGEAAFAASGTCLLRKGPTNYIVSGGSAARVFRSEPNGDWSVSDTPIIHGSAGSGIFSIAMFDLRNGVIVGGDYEKPNEINKNLAFTTDGGTTWKLGTGLSGYRSAVSYIDKKTIIAVGTNGTDITSDGGKSWKKTGSEDLNAVQSKGKKATWAVGPNGMVAKLK
jgi:photosystem II stability/assembly factor-like uncharacterized protein